MLTEHFIQHITSLQEQQRLNQELNGRLAATLGYIKIQTSLINQALDRGELHRAREQLQELTVFTADLYKG